MLAKTNRLRSAADFRGVLRRGRRHSSSTLAVSVLPKRDGSPARFGFVVTKKVGNAVSRNLVRRRLKAAARELVDGGLHGVDVVVRAMPASANSDWATLHDELVATVRGAAVG